eukprot:m51a1_g9382 putative fatty acid elongase 3-ketoacyl- synthase (1146) ;mRNA; r:220687-225631
MVSNAVLERRVPSGDGSPSLTDLTWHAPSKSAARHYLHDVRPGRSSDFYVSPQAMFSDPSPSLIATLGGDDCGCRKEWVEFCNKTQSSRGGAACMSCPRACEVLFGLRLTSMLEPFVNALSHGMPASSWRWSRGNGSAQADWGRAWIMYSSEATSLSLSYLNTTFSSVHRGKSGNLITSLGYPRENTTSFDAKWSDPYIVSSIHPPSVTVAAPGWYKGEFLGAFYVDVRLSSVFELFDTIPQAVGDINLLMLVTTKAGALVGGSDEAVETFFGSCTTILDTADDGLPKQTHMEFKGEQYEAFGMTVSDVKWIIIIFAKTIDVYPPISKANDMGVVVAIAVTVPVVAICAGFAGVILLVTRRLQRKVRNKLHKADGNMKKKLKALMDYMKLSKIMANDGREISMDSWDYDVELVHVPKNRSALEVVGMAVLHSNDLVENLMIDRTKLVHFLQALEHGYRNVPYHSSIHAADTTAALNWLIHSCTGVSFTREEKLAAIIAGLVHDYQHPGVNNNFLAATMDELYLRYNGASTLESMHVAEAMKLALLDDQLNFMGHMSKDTRRAVHQMVCQLVLSTDMAKHLELTSQFSTRISAGTLEHSKNDRLLILQMLVKLADISNATRRWDLCNRWAQRVMEEFFEQGEQEKRLGLTVSPFMDRYNTDVARCQYAFIRFVVTPMVELVGKISPAVASELGGNLGSNSLRWKAVGNLTSSMTGTNHTSHTAQLTDSLVSLARAHPVAACCAAALAFAALVARVLRRREADVYLVDYATFKAPEELRCSREMFVNNSRESGFFDEASVDFQKRLLASGGLSDNTAFPAGLLTIPPQITQQGAREECKMIFTGCMDELFAKTGVRPADIDILIVNCTIFNPIPSIATMIINNYKLRSDIKSYNLGSMGCSAGIISIDLAKDLLHLYPNHTCLIFSHENITQNWYQGNQKGMLITNTLFRIGGAAVLLSNKPSDRKRALAKLVTTVRVHTGADDASANAIFQMEDAEGRRGVRLSKELVDLVGHALEINVRILMPRILPLSEKLRFVADWLKRRMSAKYAKDAKRFVPDFHKAADYFCIHAGGRAVIDGMQKGLNLTDYDAEPSRYALSQYGNTSSSSIWYEFEFINKNREISRGKRVWQLAFGSGLKCNSAVWEFL